jgi:hypothetical protein
MAAINNIILNTEAEALEDLLSPFIKEQFPLFVQTDYPKLVLFIKAYYEWLEQEGNVGYLTSKLDTVWDVDLNLDEFYSHFKNTYLDSFPEMFAENASGNKPNKKTLLKKIRDFYGNKGTESSYKFLFRILYDSDLEFYYPKNDILKVSDGVWTEPRSIKTTVQNGTDLFGAVNGNIYQFSGVQLIASAFVNSVVQYSFNGVPITEFFITDIAGQFSPNASVLLSKDGTEWTETAYPVIGEFFVELPGSGYRVGDLVTVTDSRGTGFSAKIDQVGLAGGIKKIGISNSGVNYTGDLVLNIVSETGSRNAKVIGLRSAVTNYPGYFTGNRGKMSSNKKIQDGHYYQDFSYELKSAVSLDIYFGVLKNIIHPTGMRMFGSVLLNRSIDNALTTSSQATFYEIPLIGRYTPYTSGTTLDLRANGNTLSGYWLGATGDLYPLGYNPYIGSTSEVGPNGQTTPVGTVFVGTSLGYTYCYVPEGGRTSHNPIGAPLGSTSAFYRNRESNLTPAGMDGLVLWLKPENIGVCGSVVNGASMDVWRDASPSGNHAVPPTWSKWNGIAHITHTANTTTGWSRQVYDNTNPVTKIAFVLNGLCGGFQQGRLCMVGLNTSSGAVSGGYGSGSWVYSYGPHSSANSSDARRILYIQYDSAGNVLRNTQEAAGANLTAYDNSVFEVEYVEPYMVWRRNGVEKNRYYKGYGLSFYADSTFFLDAVYDASRTGHSVTITELSYKGTPVNPTFQASAGIDVRNYAGVTLDKLRPTLQTAGYGGVTGVSFNGGLVFSPASTYAGVTFGSVVGLGYTTGPGSSAAAVLTGQHMYLTKPLTVTDDADIFVVYKSTIDGLSYGYGLLASRNTNCDLSATPSLRFDSVLFSRSYNQQDRTLSQQNSSYYTILPNGKLMYPGASLPPAGAFGFRPCGDNTAAGQNSIVYDPHVSGACLGVCIGEAVRDSSNKIEVFLNGDEGLNKSRVTGRQIASISPPSGNEWLVSKNLIYAFDAGQTASIGSYKDGISTDILREYQMTPTPINVLAPLTASMWGRDGSPPDSVVLVTQSGAGLDTDEVFEATTGTSGNLYLNYPGTPLAWENLLTANAWTFTATIRRDDGGFITRPGVYIYTASSNPYAAAATGFDDIGGGWYKVTLTKTEPTGTSSTATLVGLTNLVPGVKYRIGRVQLLPYGTVSDIAGTATRTNSSYPFPWNKLGTANANSVERLTNPWGNVELGWRGKNHSSNATTALYNSNGGFDTTSIAVDMTKKYRFSVWVNRKVLGSGDVYFGPRSTGLKTKSTGVVNTNPYFAADGPSSNAYTGKQNTWVLVVGHVHPLGTAIGANDAASGYYTVSGGSTPYATSSGSTSVDYIFDGTLGQLAMRVFLYGSSTPGTEVQFLRPRIDLIDGTEPSIEELLNNTQNTVYDLSPTGSISSVIGKPQYSSVNGGQLAFNGKSHAIITSGAVFSNIGNIGNKTWEVWITPQPSSGDVAMFCGAGGLPYFGIVGSTQVRWSQNTSPTTSGLQTLTTWNVPSSWGTFIGKPIHLVFVSTYNATVNNTRYEIYANATGVTAGTYAGNERYSLSTVNIGNRANYPTDHYTYMGTDYEFNSSIAMVRVYDRALTKAEIQQNFNSTRNRFGV